MQRFERLEFKYYVPYEHIDELRNSFMINMKHDGFACTQDRGRYTVRSIYFDTYKFLFYREKMEGVKNRKKLRIRTYNQPGENTPAYLEIKRKYGSVICKDRVSMRRNRFRDF